MKTLLVGINAKFIHTNLAIRYIQSYAEKAGHKVDIVEYTINQRYEHILSEIYTQKPDVLGFSCYIWNIELVKKLVGEYKKIQPQVRIILGGPEVSYNPREVLEVEESVDLVSFGEGEGMYVELLNRLEDNLDNWKKVEFSEIKGIAHRDGSNQCVQNRSRDPLSMDQVPFVYENGFEEFANKIIYYETMRGCPFNCQYCLSSIEKGVRFRSFELVKDELQMFLEHKVRQVKFVDRTFNCNPKHAMNIWKYLSENDNGATNFHFEISVDLLNDEMIDFLQTVRPGLFQFEIGIQSTHDETLKVIQRKNNFSMIEKNVNRLQESNNIHLHLDLIAGLPLENYKAFRNSFNEVYALKPEQLQLGFLKVLKGSGMHEMVEEYNLVYSEYAPYEVYSTSVLTYDEMRRLKGIEEMLEQYYNSNLFFYTIQYIEGFFEDSFSLYEDLADFYIENDYHKVNHSRIGVITLLKDYCEWKNVFNIEVIKDLLIFDMCIHEKVKKFPSWYEYKQTYNKKIRDFYWVEENIQEYLIELNDYQPKQIHKMAHIEVFHYDIDLLQKGSIKKVETPMLFNYHNRDKMKNHARYYNIGESFLVC